MPLRALTAAVLVVLVAGCGQAGVNGPVDIPAGATAEGATTINGIVTVGDGAKVGQAATVNGALKLGAKVTADEARTVNGAIEVGSDTRIAQDVEAVNGGIRLGKGVDVGGAVKNVNGSIRMDGAHVAKGITTFTGDITVGSGSHVEGGIHVQKPDFESESDRIPRVVIGADSVVEGTLKFDRDVKLLVSDAAKIGPVEGATAQMFAGDDPTHIIEPAAATATETPADAPPAAGAPQKQ